MFDNDAVVLVDKEDVPKLMKVEFVQIKNKVYVKDIVEGKPVYLSVYKYITGVIDKRTLEKIMEKQRKVAEAKSIGLAIRSEATRRKWHSKLDNKYVDLNNGTTELIINGKYRVLLDTEDVEEVKKYSWGVRCNSESDCKSHVITYVRNKGSSKPQYKVVGLFRFIASLHGLYLPAGCGRIFLNGDVMDYRGDNLAFRYGGNMYYIHGAKF
jgi:hypothetical protein